MPYIDIRNGNIWFSNGFPKLFEFTKKRKGEYSDSYTCAECGADINPGDIYLGYVWHPLCYKCAEKFLLNSAQVFEELAKLLREKAGWLKKNKEKLERRTLINKF